MKVASNQHSIAAQAQKRDIVDFGFLGSQGSASIDCGGGGCGREDVAGSKRERVPEVKESNDSSSGSDDK